MKIIDMTCPHCGANLKIDGDRTEAYCEHCGAKLVIDDEVQHIQYDNAEEAGYKFEKGRQRAQAEARQNQFNQKVYRQPVQQPPVQKKRTWLWVLGWIFFFPAPIMVLIWRKKNTWDVKIKLAVTVAFWVIFFAIGSSNSSDTSSSSSEETASSKVEETQKVNQTVEEAATEISSESVSSEQEEPLNDMDIIQMGGHPTYYGSVEESHTVWDIEGIEKGKIHFGDKNYGYNDNPILTMDAYRNDDLIRGVIINFANFQQNPELTVDDVLPIVSEYTPYEVMDLWYEYAGSEIIAPDDGEGTTYYIVSYRLTEEGSTAYYAHEHSYSGSIDVFIEVEDDIVQIVDFRFGKPRWMMSLSQNKYHTEEWECNLYDYR